ncbi:ligand-binding sensor domain-containing protein [Pedobacter sp. P26]|uniref:ligand-binding sensor domain-containing protein n=1 Tax=Pedobacter sp. P26 TaxID=3423956 RepID=UPI003D676547
MVGGESGIFQFDIVSHQLKNTYSAKLNNISVMKIYPDRSMQVWVATDGGGVNLIDLQTGAVTVIGMQKNGPVLSSTAIQDVFKDPDGRLWIATLRGGVNIIDTKSKNQFKTIAKEPENPNSLVSNFTRSFCEDTNGNIWIGTSGGGLSIYNPLTGNFKNFHHQSSVKKSLSSDFVFSIIQDKRANIWIATLKGGINRYLAASNSFKHYQCINPSNSSLIPSIWKLYEDSKQNIWAAGTRGRGLFKYNQLNDRFELFDASLVDITAMYEDRSGDLWMANSSLIKINTINKKHLYVPIGTTIHSIFEDRRGNLWLGTEGEGLLLFNSKNHQIKAFTKNNGLPDNAVLNILEDSSGALWFSTFNGLGKFDFMNGKFRRFYAEDGLQSIQFNFNAALKLRSGDMIFGGLSGFDWFNPDSIKTFVNTPSIYITEFRTNNLSVQQDSAYLGRQNIMDIKHIEVDYHKAEIAVDYVALEYSYPNKINYAYFLEGWDKGWIEVGKNRTAFYSHLDVGQYKLHIRSTNTEGVWAANERIITILILPPWYRTCWAYIICAAIFLSIVYLFWHYRTSQMKLKHEMEITRFKAEKDHEINEKKISFFTDISHEFKTPLTLIMNPIKDLLKTSFGAGNGELKMIYRNAKRLLGLVDQLLLFRKAEEDLHELKITELNLTLLIEEVFQCFISQAKSKALIYNFYHNEDEVMIYADAEKMEIVLFNLIANAISFTPAGGTVDVKLTIDAQDEVKVLISDSGCGIPKGLEEKLFEKYYRVKEGRRSAPGFGIGLFLVKTFVNLHHGNISYTDNPTGGTIFILTLKKGEAVCRAGRHLRIPS